MSETCWECGRSVAFGSGRFVNRIPDGNDYEDRVVNGAPFPDGEWLCAECEEKFEESK